MLNLLYMLVKTLGITSGGQDSPAEKTEELGRVVPDPNRCVQCGVCGFNCPVGIPVRDYAHRGLAVDDPNCITCGNCIQVCPRGTLRWETRTHSLIVERFPTAVVPAETSARVLELS